MSRETPREWTEEQRMFMEWLLTPVETRHPKTITSYALQTGISVVSLYNWKKTPGFMVAVREILHAEILDAMPDVLREIVRRARNGEVQFVDRYLSLVGGSDIVAGANARRIENTMSDDDALRIMQRAVPALGGGKQPMRATIIDMTDDTQSTDERGHKEQSIQHTPPHTTNKTKE